MTKQKNGYILEVKKKKGKAGFKLKTELKSLNKNKL